MEFEKVSTILSQLEQRNDVNSIKVQELCIWPLIRLCIWTELIRAKPVAANSSTINLESLSKRTNLALNLHKQVTFKIKTDTSSAFISQPTSLQKLPDSNQWFDKIVDPLILIEKDYEKVSKYYLSPISPKTKLFYPANYLYPTIISTANSIQPISYAISDIFSQAGLPTESAIKVFNRLYRKFFKWYLFGLKIFSNNSYLKRIYLSCWYSPEKMGLIAAARKFGIQTIDIQHGKQGRFQSMYSGWTCIQEQGYHLMPNWFWCWGQPSTQHILTDSIYRSTHKPFVGGFPWPDYYRSYIYKENDSKERHPRRGNKVLFTLQSPIGAHTQPIPDFIIDYLLSDNALYDYFIFRGHPNYPQSQTYCKERLKAISPRRFRISNGEENLYDELLECTHHITAFSSCCFEAEMFNIPTLLFGNDAYNNYSEEIASRRFEWTSGKLDDLKNWLKLPTIIKTDSENQYIESSLALASKQLETIRRNNEPT